MASVRTVMQRRYLNIKIMDTDRIYGLAAVYGQQFDVIVFVCGDRAYIIRMDGILDRTDKPFYCSTENLKENIRIFVRKKLSVRILQYIDGDSEQLPDPDKTEYWRHEDY